MRVDEIMTRDMRTCTRQDNLARVVHSMWEGDCGFIPVVDEGNRVVGVLTDRDICVALATRDKTASSLLAADVLSKALHTCAPDDDVKTALATMQAQRVRRLPVVDAQKRLAGVLSMNDVVLHAETEMGRKAGAISAADVVRTFREICQHAPKTARKPAVAAVKLGRAAY
jgi:CBS domain-containing protein